MGYDLGEQLDLKLRYGFAVKPTSTATPTMLELELLRADIFTPARSVILAPPEEWGNPASSYGLVVRVRGKAGSPLPEKVKVESWSMLECELGWRYKLGEAEVGLMQSEIDLGTAVSGTVMFSEQAEDVISGWVTVLPGESGGLAGFHIGSEFLLLPEQVGGSGELLIGHKGQGPFKKPAGAPQEWKKTFYLYLPTAAGGKMTIRCSDEQAKMEVLCREGPGPYWAKHRRPFRKLVGNKYEEEFYEKSRHGSWLVTVWSKAEQYTMDVEFVQESNEAKNPETKEIPWTGNWWPTFEGKNWNPWMDNGPFDKLDKLIVKVTGYEKFHLNNVPEATTFKKWLEENVKQSTDERHGHCHVFSYMSAYKQEPRWSVIRAGIRFSPGDLKGLLIVGSAWCRGTRRDPFAWFKTYGKRIVGKPFGKGEEPDPKCWNFHIALRDTMILEDGRKKEPTPLIIEKHKGAAGSNSPMYKVRFYFIQKDPFILFKVAVKATIHYTDYEDKKHDRVGPKPAALHYRYVLAYDDFGRVRVGDDATRWGSKWKQDEYPDFIWTRQENDPTLNWFKQAQRGRIWERHERIPFYKIVEMLLSPKRTIIYGQVVDSTGNPVRNVVVRVAPLRGGTYKNAYIGRDGRFAFFEAWPGGWVIYVRAQGYEPRLLDLRIPAPPEGKPVPDTPPLKIVLERR